MYDLKDERWIKNLKQMKEKEYDKKVVLTFDDGPSRNLPKILQILEEKDVQAMFFWQSRLLHRERPWKKVLRAGHTVGSHAVNHKNLTTLTKEDQYKQIHNSVKKIEQITNIKVNYFRPPFGQYNEDTLAILHEVKLIPIMWDISSYDWELKDKPNQIVCNVTSHIKDGSIILLHELKQTVQILPDLIDKIREQGYEFTILSSN